MRQIGLPQAIAAFAIPPHAPPAVIEAKVAFDSIAARWARTKGDLQDAIEGLKAAKQADLETIVKMAEQGKNVAEPQARQRKAEDTIADLRVRLKGLDMAVDEAGNRLAEAIAAHRNEWLPQLAKAEADAATRFDEAVASALAALDQLRPARGAVAWLHGFDTELAYQGQFAQFAGGRLEVKSWGVLKGSYDPSLLLETAAKVTHKEMEVTDVRTGTHQFTQAEVQAMTPEQIVEARKAGQLNEYLGVPVQPPQFTPTDKDGNPRPITDEDLKVMTPEQIVTAHRAGQLRHLGIAGGGKR